MRCVWTLHNCHECGRHYDDPPDVCECGHKLRCSNSAVVGLSFCPIHGGGRGKSLGIRNIPSGPSVASKNVLIREASAVALDLPIKKRNTFKSKELAQRYEEAINDPELVALRRPLAITSARVQQLLDRVEDGVTTDLWKSATEAYAELKRGIMTGSEEEIYRNIDLLDNIFKKVSDDYKSWSQVFEALDLQRKLSESERKRLLEMKQFVTAEEAMNMVRALTASIYKNVQDEMTLRRIIYEFSRITGANPSTSNNDSGTEGGTG